MTLFMIDQQKCRKDGLCAAVCPRGIIALEIDTYPHPVAGAEEQCISCGHCSAVCPHGALELKGTNPASWPITDLNRMPSSENLIQLIRHRRSTRVYQQRPVARETLQDLIDLARYAPTARNSQMLHWLVVDSPAELAELKGHLAAWVEELVAKDDPLATAYGFEKVLKDFAEGKDPLLRHCPGLVILHAPAAYPFGLIDSTIAMTTFDLAASAGGLGCCWAGFFMIAAKAWQPLRDALRLPEGQVLTTAMMVGYPKYRYRRFPERRKAEITWR
jgi:nitroreductase/NAD-dependent dihydropyrimidine dehydrogenase PreA subunit